MTVVRGRLSQNAPDSDTLAPCRQTDNKVVTIRVVVAGKTTCLNAALLGDYTALFFLLLVRRYLLTQEHT
jgi:hypothetical protein